MKQKMFIFGATFALVACGGEVLVIGQSSETTNGIGGGSAISSTSSMTSAGVAGQGGVGGVIQTGGTEETGGTGGTGSMIEKKMAIFLDPLTPASAIVIAGKDSWVPYSQYEVHNVSQKDQEVVAAQIQQKDPNGDVEDFVRVALAMDGTTRLVGDEHYTTDFEYFSIDDVENPFVIPAGQTVTVQVWAKTANVLPSSATGEKWHGFPRSGHSDSLRLQHLQLASDPPNVVQVSKEQKNPPSMVLRKSVLIIIQQALTTNTLSNTDQDLIKFQIAADGAGAIGIRELRFMIHMSNGVSLSMIGIRRGSSEIPGSQVHFHTDIPEPDMVNVEFEQDEMIMGSGNVYTLHAPVFGATSGSYVITQLIQSDAELAPVTGYISFCNPEGFWKSVSPVYSEDVQNQCQPLGLLWSDLSEVPHDSSGHKSSDWTNDNLVRDTNLSQTLSL